MSRTTETTGSAAVTGPAGATETAGPADAAGTTGSAETAAGTTGSAEATGSTARAGAAGAEATEPAQAVGDAEFSGASRASEAGEAGGGPESGESAGEIEVSDHISVPGADGKPVRGTRRFPMFTRDTARPEGGGRAAPREAPAPVRQWPILAVLSTVALGLLLTALDAFRVGTILIGVALLAGAALRWAVRDVGMLAVRSRFTDMATYIVLGTTIVLLALMAQPRPLLEIPFLKDTLHFTVGDEETG